MNRISNAWATAKRNLPKTAGRDGRPQPPPTDVPTTSTTPDTTTLPVRTAWGALIPVEVAVTSRDRDLAERHSLPLATVVVARLRTTPAARTPPLPDKPGFVRIRAPWGATEIYAPVTVTAADKQHAKRIVGGRAESFAVARMKRERGDLT